MRRHFRPPWTGQGVGERSLRPLPGGCLGRPTGGIVAAMQPRDVARLADRLAGDLMDPQNTNVYRRSNQASALAVYSTRMEPQDATRVVEQLDSALANPQETDADRLSDLGLALAALLARIEPGRQHARQQVPCSG